ncbi:hypothetical protein F2Q70_00036422 [Brassica cretica]|uniref:Uncharacterized protein n=1 Tax=Brassica cretica TaxID=69181 RepID=A0A8S9JR07_BRACR|nr:hypothetical protein F2Q70_00036422 [Brassica cretica]KAF3527561.1 hypothetical protein DY000_02041328 [Brassica cretica]
MNAFVFFTCFRAAATTIRLRNGSVVITLSLILLSLISLNHMPTTISSDGRFRYQVIESRAGRDGFGFDLGCDARRMMNLVALSMTEKKRRDGAEEWYQRDCRNSVPLLHGDDELLIADMPKEDVERYHHSLEDLFSILLS